jgi:hypothetical protein
MILWSPYGSTYTFVLLLIPFLALVKTDIATSKKITGLVLIFVVSNIPLAWFTAMAFPFSYPRLLALLLLFALILFVVYGRIRFRNAALVALVPMVLVLLFADKAAAKSDAVLGKNSPILIYDYTLEDNRLTYFYWNEKGENQASIPFTAQQASTMVLHDNQIFHNGTQLTLETSNKRKPMLVNGNTLVYLSDVGRGIGFFTLRTIELGRRPKTD